MKIKVSSDSTCDLTPDLIAAHNIAIMPLVVVKDGVYCRDCVDITPKDIYAHVDKGGDLCTTTAVNVEEYRAFFAAQMAGHDAVIHINIGSEFSCCHQNALLAAEEFPNVFVVDSRNLSNGQGHIVLEACRLARESEDPATLSETLRALTDKVETSFILNRLDYMVKGGRCSHVLALGANLLKLKPCIEVVDGTLQVTKKYRGQLDKCVTEFLRERLEGRDDIRRDVVFLPHTPLPDGVLEVAEDALRRYGNFATLYRSPVNCTIACHCGPGTIGIVLLRS